MAALRQSLRLAAALAASVCAGLPPALAESGPGPTLTRIQANKTIYLGYREAVVPFSFLATGQPGEAPQGYSWDVCARIVDALRQQLAMPDLKVTPILLSSTTRMMMVKMGMADMECGATTNTVARQKQVGFSNTIYVAEAKVMVRADAGVRSLNDLAGKTIVTTAGSTGDRLVKTAALTRGIVFKYLVAQDHDEAMRLLAQGKAQGYVGEDSLLAAQRAAQANPGQYAYLDEGLSIEPYGLVLPKDDPQFKSLVDQTLAGLMKSGELEKIYNKWFMGPIPPKGLNLNLPMSDLLKAAIQYPGDQPAQQ